MSLLTDILGGGASAGEIFGALGLGAGGGFLTKAAYDRLTGLGEQAKTEATGLAGEIMPMTQFKPFTVTSATGGQFGVGAGGDVSMTLSPQERAIQNMMMTGAQQTLGATPFGQQMGRDAAQQAFGLGGQFMEQSGMPTADRESAIYERIRAAQSPEEQRQQLALEERLAQQGRLGVRTGMFGGTPEQLAMSKAQAEAQNTAMLQAMQQAQREQAQQAQLGQTYTGLGGQMRQQDLAQQMGQQQLGMGMLGGAYMPQAQLLNVQQASQLYPQLQQQAQLFGAGQYGETMMTGIEAQLLAEQKAADLIGGIGSTLLGGLFS